MKLYKEENYDYGNEWSLYPDTRYVDVCENSEEDQDSFIKQDRYRLNTIHRVKRRIRNPIKPRRVQKEA
jgi:hypothetical protein